MLKPNDKIITSRNGKTLFVDTVISIDKKGIAHTKNGQKFAAKCKVLKPLRGLNDYGYSYEKIGE